MMVEGASFFQVDEEDDDLQEKLVNKYAVLKLLKWVSAILVVQS